MLPCCITLSSSRENQHSAQEVAASAAQPGAFTCAQKIVQAGDNSNSIKLKKCSIISLGTATS